MLALDSICIPPVNTLPLGGHIKCLWGGRWCLESELSTEPSVLVQCCSLSSSLQVISKILWHDCWCFVTVSDILIFCLSDAATHDREAVMGNSQRKRLVGEWRYVYQCCCYLCYSVFRVIPSFTDLFYCLNSRRWSHSQSDKHWSCFEGNFGETSEMAWGTYGLPCACTCHLELN